MPKSLTTYFSLLREVKETLILGQERLEKEKVRIYWETGRLIYAHILKHKDRGEYVVEVISRLAKDLNIHVSLLQRSIQFAKSYPSLPKVAGRRLFTWSHYRELMTIPDTKQRLQLEEKAARNDWSAEELAIQVKARRPERRDSLEINFETPSTVFSHKPLTPQRGQLYTCKIVQRPALGSDESGTELLVDLGFGVFRNVEPKLLSGFADGDIVESRPKEDAYRFYKTDRTAQDLYTYCAFVEKVIDADTLKVRFDLGFDTWARETLRLRGIDAPEMDTAEGQAAKAFVQSYIKDAQRVIVRSSRSDKYDRYLADVYIPQGEEADSATELYLNNMLLENGHAVRMTE